jgi:hypothetical protein
MNGRVLGRPGGPTASERQHPRAPDLQESGDCLVSEGGLEPPRPLKDTSTSS